MRPMNRRPFLFAPILLASPALAQRAPAPTAPPPAERDRADLARVEAYLNALTTMRARFLQIAQNGAAAEGTAWIWRPGRMRFEYDPPEPLLLVADGGQFLMYDRELRAPTTLLVSRTPLGILLRPQVRLSGDVTVAGIERNEQADRIQLDTLRRAADAMDCELVYALVPRTSLEEAVQAQAEAKARRHLGQVGHHSRLEDQAIPDEAARAQLDDLVERLIDKRGLWSSAS